MKAVQCITFCVFVFIPALLFAQESQKSVLYLRNGSVIKGHIVELIPDSTAKIQTDDGSLFVFKSTDILRIQADVAAAGDSTTDKIVSGKKNKQHKPSPFRFSLSIGIAFPTGDLGDKNNGNASTGFTAGFLLMPNNPAGVLIDGSYTSNSLQSGNSGYWTSIFLLGGYKIPFTESENNVVSIAPLLGAFFGSTPPITTGWRELSGATAIVIGYGVRLDVQVTPNIYFAARYVGSNPTYTFNIEGYNAEYKPSTGFFNIMAGVAF